MNTVSSQTFAKELSKDKLPRFIGERSAYVNSNPADYALVSKSANSRRTYISRLNQVAQLFHFDNYQEVPWHLLRHEHVRHVVKTLKIKNLAATTINTTLSTLREVSREAFNLGQLSGEDLTRILHVKLEKGTLFPTGRHISINEVKSLVLVCEDDQNATGLRDIAIIGLMYVCGLRRTEIAQLVIGDFSQLDNSLKCDTGNANERTCWPDAGTRAALLDWFAARGSEFLSDDAPMFTPIRRGGKIIARKMTDQSIYNVIAKRRVQAGLRPCTPHDFRRSFVTNMLDSNVDVQVTQRLAGHSNPATTLRYDRRKVRQTKQVGEIIRLPYPGNHL